MLIGEQDGLDAVTRFGMGSLGFPFTVFTDNQGRIVLTHLGELTRPQSAVMIDAVTRVNHGELTPVAARTVAARQLEEIEPPRRLNPPRAESIPARFLPDLRQFRSTSPRAAVPRARTESPAQVLRIYLNQAARQITRLPRKHR